VVEPLTCEDYERLAAARLAPDVWEYVAGGAADELTLGANRRAFERWVFRPRVLVDVGEVSTAVTVLGTQLALPVIVGPVAYQGLFDPEGELATARAARAAGTAFCVSTMTTRSHVEIAAAAPGIVQWAQLYVLRDRGATVAHLEEAAGAGCTAVVLTVDTPVIGSRDRERRAAFAVPPELPLPYLRGLLGAEHEPVAAAPPFSPSVTWRDLEWIAGATGLPLLVKGISTREDAVLAVEHGAAGVVVSNHGGRQLDGAPAALDALPEVVEAVAGRVEVLLDGGIRRGGDVVKALALGAKGVLAGRAPVFGLAAAGERGVRHVLDLLRDEVAVTLALLGCTSPAEVARVHVQPAVSYDSRA
jgi:4-hydroxymandelate oxidase